MPTTPPSITALPAPPDPNDRSTFNARAYPWSVAQQTLATEVAAVADNVFDNATEAAAAAALAVPAAAAAEAASNATLWVSGTTYAAGDVVWSPINALSYRRKTAGAGTTDPSADSANWASLAGGTPSLTRSARTSNTILGTADKGTLIDITSGTFSQTFDAVATLGDGWWCYLRNSGTGDITLEPDGAETIDGLANYVMYPGEVRLVQCDGAALRSIVINAFAKTFTASGTFTRPPGYSSFSGLLWGGGGSGRKGGAATSRTGGSGAACSPFQFRAALLSASESVVIGAGGESVTANSTNGNSGGYSSFAGIFAAPGQGGTSAASVGGGTAYSQNNYSVLSASSNHVISGSYGSGANLSCKGYFGGDTARPNATNGSIYGAGAGGGLDTNDTVDIGGASVFGGSGGASSKTGNSDNGNTPGGGGGAAQDGVGNSGAGARGELRIYGVI